MALDVDESQIARFEHAAVVAAVAALTVADNTLVVVVAAADVVVGVDAVAAYCERQNESLHQLLCRLFSPDYPGAGVVLEKIFLKIFKI